MSRSITGSMMAYLMCPRQRVVSRMWMAAPGYPPKKMYSSSVTPNARCISSSDQCITGKGSNRPARLSWIPVNIDQGADPRITTRNGQPVLRSPSQRPLMMPDQFRMRWTSSSANTRPRGERFASARARFQVETSHSGPGARPGSRDAASGGAVSKGGFSGVGSSTATYQHRSPLRSSSSQAWEDHGRLSRLTGTGDGDKTHGTHLGEEVDQAGYEGAEVGRLVGHGVRDRQLSKTDQLPIILTDGLDHHVETEVLVLGVS